LKQLAHYDVLTNLPNRVLFYERLKSELAEAVRLNCPMAVLFIDVDRFKYVNDTLGHAAGDKLLQQVAGRLSQAVRARDTVGRLGGDEFAVVAAQLKESADARRVAQKIIAAFNEPLEVDGVELFVTRASVSLCPGTARTRMSSYATQMPPCIAPRTWAATPTRSSAGHERSRARPDHDATSCARLEREEFVLTTSPRCISSRASSPDSRRLLRWQRDEQILLMPGDFVPMLEKPSRRARFGKG